MEGCRRLALFDKDSTGLNATKAAIKTVGGNANPDVFIRHVDNLDTYEVGKNMELAIRHFGRIDYAINCGAMYSASKAAIISLTRSDAIDYAKDQIRVNCVCPGVIETPMTANVPEDDPAVQTAVMKRKGTPQEVTDAILFLSSPKASFIQSAALSVDGGYTIS
ncbi:3-oxoacyl-[acyl-carrier protein] reductase [Fusarium verticillioides 7600]|uniref:3-oxoacyl-[acyl-carrier protein] reductase n=1 Tax=Gibberella moniliformis (strain M3125 / FGSC 7600) TaxID=334819 RepID=W7MED6_GIBM7|nr:3-oxoacyl-[acyl-carrier protein] reductase [Fusarium verticillioides 7600]EWG43132.1 3-oxoacyl-[acyl-carrier protein] reductase [Fusarium verticillioides 7600]